MEHLLRIGKPGHNFFEHWNKIFGSRKCLWCIQETEPAGRTNTKRIEILLRWNRFYPLSRNTTIDRALAKPPGGNILSINLFNQHPNKLFKMVLSSFPDVGKPDQPSKLNFKPSINYTNDHGKSVFFISASIFIPYRATRTQRRSVLLPFNLK